MRHLRRLGFGALVLAACGKNNYALVDVGDGGATDAGVEVTDTGAPAGNEDGGTTPEATVADADVDADATPAAACDLTAPFGAPVMVFGVASGFTAASLSADETIMLVTGYGPQDDQDLFIATRGKPTAEFGTPTRVAGLSTVGADEEALALTPDGRTLYFQRQISDGGTTTFTTFRAERASVTDDFGAAVPTYGTTRVDSLFVTSNGNTYAGVFNSNTLDDLELVSATGFSTALFGSLNSSAWDDNAALTGDELTLYFTSTRSGDDVTDFENADIYLATRTSKTDAFGSPTPVSELESPRYDTVNWISADGCRLYFTSDRGVDVGNVLYLATKPPN